MYILHPSWQINRPEKLLLRHYGKKFELVVAVIYKAVSVTLGAVVAHTRLKPVFLSVINYLAGAVQNINYFTVCFVSVYTD